MKQGKGRPWAADTLRKHFDLGLRPMEPRDSALLAVLFGAYFHYTAQATCEGAICLEGGDRGWPRFHEIDPDSAFRLAHLFELEKAYQDSFMTPFWLYQQSAWWPLGTMDLRKEPHPGRPECRARAARNFWWLESRAPYKTFFLPGLMVQVHAYAVEPTLNGTMGGLRRKICLTVL